MSGLDQLTLGFEPTEKQVCWMCHLSSGCKGCCKKCRNSCNASQHCMQSRPHQADRLDAWMRIVREIPDYEQKRLRRVF